MSTPKFVLCRWKLYIKQDGNNQIIIDSYEHSLRCVTQSMWIQIMITSLTHSERRPQNIYSQEEMNLYCIIKLETEFLYFRYKSVKLDVLGRQHKIWTFDNPFQSKKKRSQFAPRRVIFNLCICCQFEDLQIISAKIIPMSHRNI